MPGRNATLREKVHYQIDNYLAKGSSALFLSLLIAFLIAFAVIAVLRLLFYWVSPDTDAGLFDQLWKVYLQLTAPGNMNQDSHSPHHFKVPAILAGLTGVVIFSTLIATLTTALNQAIRRLKRGHSRVLESGHTLILGWTHRVPEILRELVEANESEDNPCVVILSEKDKEWMDDYLRAHFKDRSNLRIVTRSGTPASPDSLLHVSVQSAKSVIVLANCDENSDHETQLRSDARGIKTMLALESAAPEAEFPIVIELYHPRNRDVVKNVTPGRVFMVDAEEILAKVMVQTSRTSGLSVVYSELLSFEGCEMYFYNANWNGITFGKCQFHFPDGVPIGIRTPDGSVTIRPPLDRVLAPKDEVLIIAEDDSTIEFRKDPVAQPNQRTLNHRRLIPKKERMLLLGWSPKAHIIVSEYAEYVAEGSGVTIALHEPSTQIVKETADVTEENETLNIEVVHSNPFDINEIKKLKPFEFDDIMILPQKLGPEKNAESIDTETIVLLLLLRGLKKQLIEDGQTVTTKIVTEVLDSNNHSLIHQAGVNDFIISNRMVSMIFAQMSEEPGIKLVYDDLFQEEGSEIYVKPIELYLDELPAKVPFADLMALAHQRDEEACIGVKIATLSTKVEENYGVNLIPPKNEVIELNPGDALVVVAEDER